MIDLFSADHFNQKNWERVKNAKPADFEPWDEAKERYIAEKVEQERHDMNRQQRRHGWDWEPPEKWRRR